MASARAQWWGHSLGCWRRDRWGRRHFGRKESKLSGWCRAESSKSASLGGSLAALSQKPVGGGPRAISLGSSETLKTRHSTRFQIDFKRHSVTYILTVFQLKTESFIHTYTYTYIWRALGAMRWLDTLFVNFLSLSLASEFNTQNLQGRSREPIPARGLWPIY